MTTSRPGRGRTVTILGGTGFFGGRVAADVLTATEASVVLASRRPPRRSLKPSARIAWVRSDIEDPASMRRLAEQSDVLVHCAGPFRGQAPVVAMAALEAGAHYVDISEDLGLARRIRYLDGEARRRAIALLTGASVVPGMEVIVAAELVRHFDRVESFRGFAAPDLHHVRGRAMYRTMLQIAGHPAPLWRRGRRRWVPGWSEPEWVWFPPPVGRRLVYLVPGVADQEEIPLLGYETVEFRAGSEHPALNRLLATVAAVHGRARFVPLDRLGLVARLLSRVPSKRLEPGGAAMFEATGWVGGVPATCRIGVVAEADGGRVPAILAGIAVEGLLDGSIQITGARTTHEWCSWPGLLHHVRRRGLRTVRQWDCGVDGGERISSSRR